MTPLCHVMENSESLAVSVSLWAELKESRASLLWGLWLVVSSLSWTEDSERKGDIVHKSQKVAKLSGD